MSKQGIFQILFRICLFCVKPKKLKCKWLSYINQGIIGLSVDAIQKYLRVLAYATAKVQICCNLSAKFFYRPTSFYTFCFIEETT